MEAKVYNKDGQETAKISLPEKIFGLPWNADLVHQVVVSMQSNARQVIAHAKGRGEVSGGGKKPWRQKGTGRARHGSTRSPIWRHGGVTHGPTSERNFERKINKKMKTQALYTILSAKLRDGEIIFVDNIGLAAPRTKEAHGSLQSLAKAGFEKINYKRGKRALITVPTMSESVKKSFRNIQSVAVDTITNLNPADAMRYKYLVMVDPDASVAAIAGRKK
jgi:large subunit ribosomal protein L4